MAPTRQCWLSIQVEAAFGLDGSDDRHEIVHPIVPEERRCGCGIAEPLPRLAGDQKRGHECFYRRRNSGEELVD